MSRARVFVGLLAVSFLIVSAAHADNIYWTDGDPGNSNWSDDDNWDVGHPPVPGTDQAYFSLGDTTVNLDVDGDVNGKSMYLFPGKTGTVIVNSNAGKKLIVGTLFAGYDLECNVPVEAASLRTVDDNVTATFNDAVSPAGSVLATKGGSGYTNSWLEFNAPTTSTVSTYAYDYSQIRMGDPMALPSGRIYLFGPGVVIDGLSGTRTVKLKNRTLGLLNLSPGASAGTITIYDDAVNTAGQINLSETTLFELGALGAAQDLVLVQNDVNLTLGGTLEIQDLGGLEEGEYTLFDLDPEASWDGAFDSIIVPGGLSGSIKAGEHDVILDVVPEPTTLGLLALGGLAVLRRRRR